MKRSVVNIMADAFGLLIDIFRNVRNAREAEDVVNVLRKLRDNPPRRADLDGIADDIMARHSDGTGSSD